MAVGKISARGRYVVPTAGLPVAPTSTTTLRLCTEPTFVRRRADAAREDSSMKINRLTHTLVGLLIMVKDPRCRDERGLSQSAENAILIAGAVAIAVAIVGAIRAFVLSRLPS